jgi:hypothetical protein
VSHEPRYEVNVAAEPVELGDGYVAPEFPCGGQGGLELRAAVQSVCKEPYYPE